MEKQNQDTNPITKKEEVQESNDNRIDEDFKNFPHNPASEKLINPKTTEDKVNAQVKESSHSNKPEGTSGEPAKIVKPHDEEESAHAGSTGKSMATTDFPGNEDDSSNKNAEAYSDGSGGAFEATERMTDDEDTRRIEDK